MPSFKRRSDARKRHPAADRGRMTVSKRRFGIGYVQKQGRGLWDRIMSPSTVENAKRFSNAPQSTKVST
jgi:hypothetical protein